MTFALSILAFFVLGVIVFYLDSRIGVSFNRSWYNMTHKNKLDPNIKKGFVVNASFVSRFIIALLTVSLTFLISLKYGNLHALEYTWLAIVQFVGMILGFYFASKILKIVPPGINKAAKFLDKIEKGEVNLKEEIVDSSKKVVEVIKKEKLPKKKEKEKDIPKGNSKEEKEVKKGDEDWRKGIDDFMKK